MLFFADFLSEEGAEGFFDLADGVDLDGELAAVEALQVVARDDDVAEAQFLGLGDALLDAVDGAHLAGEAYLAGHAPAGLDGGVDIAAQHGGYDREVHGQVGDAQSAGYVEEDVFLHEFEAYALLEHGQQHVEPALVEAGGGALGGAVGG